MKDKGLSAALRRIGAKGSFYYGLTVLQCAQERCIICFNGNHSQSAFGGVRERNMERASTIFFGNIPMHPQKRRSCALFDNFHQCPCHITRETCADSLAKGFFSRETGGIMLEFMLLRLAITALFVGVNSSQKSLAVFFQRLLNARYKDNICADAENHGVRGCFVIRYSLAIGHLAWMLDCYRKAS